MSYLKLVSCQSRKQDGRNPFGCYLEGNGGTVLSGNAHFAALWNTKNHNNCAGNLASVWIPVFHHRAVSCFL